MATGDYPQFSNVRSCCCVGYLTNPGGRCCMDLPQGKTYVTDKIVIGGYPKITDEESRRQIEEAFKPHDDPLAPAPSPLAGSWQCPFCLTVYNMTVNACHCQVRTTTSDRITLR